MRGLLSACSELWCEAQSRHQMTRAVSFCRKRWGPSHSGLGSTLDLHKVGRVALGVELFGESSFYSRCEWTKSNLSSCMLSLEHGDVVHSTMCEGDRWCIYFRDKKLTVNEPRCL